jgi:hypothetical protein
MIFQWFWRDRNSSLKCWRHGPDRWAFGRHSPLIIFKMSNVQGGICLSGAHWLGPGSGYSSRPSVCLCSVPGLTVSVTVLVEWRIMTNSAYVENNGDGLLCSILSHEVSWFWWHATCTNCVPSFYNQPFNFIIKSTKNLLVSTYAVFKKLFIDIDWK